jgi:hypothetical protein
MSQYHEETKAHIAEKMAEILQKLPKEIKYNADQVESNRFLLAALVLHATKRFLVVPASTDQKKEVDMVTERVTNRDEIFRDIDDPEILWRYGVGASAYVGEKMWSSMCLGALAFVTGEVIARVNCDDPRFFKGCGRKYIAKLMECVAYVALDQLEKKHGISAKVPIPLTRETLHRLWDKSRQNSLEVHINGVTPEGRLHLYPTTGKYLNELYDMIASYGSEAVTQGISPSILFGPAATNPT